MTEGEISREDKLPWCDGSLRHATSQRHTSFAGVQGLLGESKAVILWSQMDFSSVIIRCYEIDDIDWDRMNIDGGGEGVDGSHFRSALLIAVVRAAFYTRVGKQSCSH